MRAKLNTTEEQHTFHIHVNDFQLMSVNGKPYPFHCHILNHEDRGMMANVEVVR
ncbi:multicopper oxidase domain-containing protein [Nonomuraea insulae]|uniref:Multicopper oxidase domain-containing protein n=1 Tax=Nonomuraea insulae TaxID=1616787 RepID=A0ABW1D5Y7_9ACTN